MLQILPSGVVTVAYIGATILFILALGGLSHPETARRGNLFGIVGMSIALLATVFGVVTENYGLLIGALIIGILRNGCVLYDIPNTVQDIVVGAIIIAAAAIDQAQQRRRG